MGNLPKFRLEPIRPFYKSGVDFAGPFLINVGRTRRMRKVKAYIALFICFATKAIHLELVGDLTKESFLGALKRFISRRGNVAELYSDNGSNFVGAERELFRSQNFQSSVINSLSAKNTKFHFIPPRSPHFGGLWERAIKSVKMHLQRVVVVDASLTYEEFYTFLTCVEACLNRRSQRPRATNPGSFLDRCSTYGPSRNLLKTNPIQSAVAMAEGLPTPAVFLGQMASRLSKPATTAS